MALTYPYHPHGAHKIHFLLLRRGFYHLPSASSSSFSFPFLTMSIAGTLDVMVYASALADCCSPTRARARSVVYDAAVRQSCPATISPCPFPYMSPPGTLGYSPWELPLYRTMLPVPHSPPPRGLASQLTGAASRLLRLSSLALPPPGGSQSTMGSDSPT